MSKKKYLEILRTFILSVLAGVMIGIGGTVFLSLENKTVGALFFSVGLFIILTFQFNLFTGKVCYLFDNKLKYILDLFVIWIGNFAGTFITARLLTLTRIGEKLASVANGLVEAKINDSLISLFFLGIFCNILIYIAVEGFKNNKHELGKYLGIIFGVVVFILCGFEHSVADMFYFSMAGDWNTVSFIAIIVISLGNTVGGLIIPAIVKIVGRLRL